MKQIVYEIPDDKVEAFWNANLNVDKTGLGAYQFWKYVKSIVPPDFGFDWKRQILIGGDTVLYPVLIQDIDVAPSDTKNVN